MKTGCKGCPHLDDDGYCKIDKGEMLKKALDELLDAIAKQFRLYQLLEFIEKKLERFKWLKWH